MQCGLRCIRQRSSILSHLASRVWCSQTVSVSPSSSLNVLPARVVAHVAANLPWPALTAGQCCHTWERGTSQHWLAAARPTNTVQLCAHAAHAIACSVPSPTDDITLDPHNIQQVPGGLMLAYCPITTMHHTATDTTSLPPSLCHPPSQLPPPPKLKTHSQDFAAGGLMLAYC